MNMMGKFGMHEMEKAAEVICFHPKGKNFGIGDFDLDSEKVGFLELLCAGWMQPGEYNGLFIPKDSFWERVGV